MHHKFPLLSVICAAALLGLGSASAARADEDPRVQTARGFWLFGGLDVGPVYLGAERASPGESNKGGYQFGLKVLGSYYSERWVWDLGLGWTYHRLSGQLGSAPETVIRARAGFAEAGLRYRLSERLSLGPVLNLMFGTDLSYKPLVSSNDAQSALLGGLQFLYEIPLDHWRIRLGARGLTDLNVTDRQVWIGQAVVQIGLPIGASPVSQAEPYVPPRVETAAVVADEDAQPDIQVSLDMRLINFDTGSSKLKAKTDRVLKNLGRFLARNNGVWQKIRVDGHTDVRGSFAYNLKLSFNRANSVKSAIISGAPKTLTNRVEARGFSFTQPVDQGSTPEAYAKNRRVELRFYGVSDPLVLKEGIEKLERDLGGLE